MGFLKRIFGRDEGEGAAYVDKHGFYFYVQCGRCGSYVRVRADKRHDLNREDGGFVWHKEIMDSRCFRLMRAVVHLDGHYQVTSQEIEGGRFVTREEYEQAQTAGPETEDVSQPTDEEE